MTALAFAPNGVQKSSLSNVIEEWFSNDSLRRGNLKSPSTNIIEHDDKFIIQLSVPGYTKDAFQISIVRNQLTVSTLISDHENVETDSYRMKEFSRFSFSKSFNLSDAIDIDSITATCNHGILAILLPKKDEAKTQPPRSIEIK